MVLSMKVETLVRCPVRSRYPDVQENLRVDFGGHGLTVYPSPFLNGAVCWTPLSLTNCCIVVYSHRSHIAIYCVSQNVAQERL